MRSFLPAARPAAPSRAPRSPVAVAGVVAAARYLAAYVLVGPGVARGYDRPRCRDRRAVPGRGHARRCERELQRRRGQAPLPVRAGPQQAEVDPAPGRAVVRRRGHGRGGAGPLLEPPRAPRRAGRGRRGRRRSWRSTTTTLRRGRRPRWPGRSTATPTDGSVRLHPSRARSARWTPGGACSLRPDAAAEALVEGYLSAPEPATGAAADPGRRGRRSTRPRSTGSWRRSPSRRCPAPVSLTVETTTTQIRPRADRPVADLRARPAGHPGARARRRARCTRRWPTSSTPCEKPARDASFGIVDEPARVVPLAQGREVLPETLAGAVLPVLTETGAARAVTVPLERSEPEVDTATREVPRGDASWSPTTRPSTRRTSRRA